MIVALGESIVAIGVGAAGLPLDAPRIAAALFGMVVAASGGIESSSPPG